jgi:hypothetical protein
MGAFQNKHNSFWWGVVYRGRAYFTGITSHETGKNP